MSGDPGNEESQQETARQATKELGKIQYPLFSSGDSDGFYGKYLSMSRAP